MRFGFSEACLTHETGPRHPESPDRLRAIERTLAKSEHVQYAEAPPATRDQLHAVHDDSYVAELREFCERGGGHWTADTIAVEETWDAVRASAGLAEWAGRRALAGDDRRVTPFALGRPPGHHATAHDAMGFCFFNNVAIATQSVIESSDAESVAIIDWDVHHGNGTQELFYDRGDVFYASIHQDTLYPGTGHTHETGRGEGNGATVNVPFPSGTTHAGYLAALDRVIGPAIADADPDLLLVSAGFDAHEDDQMSQMRVSTDGFGLLAERVRELAVETAAGLGFVLEGGYNLKALAESVRMVHNVFNGEGPPQSRTMTPQDGAVAVIDEVLAQGFG